MAMTFGNYAASGRVVRNRTGKKSEVESSRVVYDVVTGGCV